MFIRAYNEVVATAAPAKRTGNILMYDLPAAGKGIFVVLLHLLLPLNAIPVEIFCFEFTFNLPLVCSFA